MPGFALKLRDVVGFVAVGEEHFEGDVYVEWYDPDAHGGRGDVKGAKDIRKAKRYPTYAAAHAEWPRQSKTRPYRPDGKPNRPLTADPACEERSSGSCHATHIFTRRGDQLRTISCGALPSQEKEAYDAAARLRSRGRMLQLAVRGASGGTHEG